MSIHHRLGSIISALGETPASFSEKLGIQRSSLSHLLSSRNKPSVDFLEKLYAVFPQVNIAWLIVGKGEMMEPPHTENPIREELPDDVHENKPSDPHFALEDETPDRQESEERKPSGIVWFYTDGTFEVFRPR